MSAELAERRGGARGRAASSARPVSRRFGWWLLAGALALPAAPAHAGHVAGATYSGTAATGGTVQVEVSPDGGSVTRFEASDVPTDCGTVGVSVNASIPIVNHAFSWQSTDGWGFSGSFDAGQQARGTLWESAGADPDDDCAYSVGWNAKTSAAAPPPSSGDVTPPAVDARAGRRLRPGGVIIVRVRCPAEPCRIAAGGSVSLRGRAKSFRLRTVSTQLAQGDSVRLGPRLGRRGLAAVRRALRSGRAVTARLRVTAVDGAGNRTVRRLSVRVR
jgi:hypothetical protein